MSPRSAEFMASARERLSAAARAAGDEHWGPAISLAYYAMLYAARAALSEEDRYAKTHSGTWNLFYETFVLTGRFDATLHARARRVQPMREAADYDAVQVSGDEAVNALRIADGFVAAVADLIG